MADEAEILEPSSEIDSQGVDEPSPSSDVEPTLDDAIRDALAAMPDEGPVESEDPVEEQEDSSPQAEAKPEEVEQEAEPVDPDEAFIQMLKENEVPLGKIDRFKELIQERNTLRSEVESAEEIRGQIASIELAGRKLGLNEQEVGNMFASLVVMQDDPEKGYQMLNEVQASLAAKLGHQLPPDLQEKVDEGYLDAETAARVAQAEAKAQLSDRAAKELEEQYRVQQAAETQNAITTAVNTYHQQIRESDPDYANPQIAEAKDEILRKELLSLVQTQGQPTSVEAARQMAEQAYESTNKVIKALRPTPTPQRPISSRGNVATSAAQPKTMLEAIEAALQ